MILAGVAFGLFLGGGVLAASGDETAGAVLMLLACLVSVIEITKEFRS